MNRLVLSPSTSSSRAMDKYEQLAVVGEGSYGVVLKCKRRDNGQLVAIKKFLETEDDAAVRKMALREIRMLKKLRHDNLVNLIEVFRRKRRFYLVFEYLDHTLLDELEGTPGGLGEETTKRHLLQLLRAMEYCHQNAVIHRDVKPENVLISSSGVVKLCDMGFARALAAPGEPYTEYVATRWYRAPELLVADHRYGPEVDIWAVGCLFAEMMTGDPLFPGDSDIDQLALIIKTVGKLSPRHQQVVSRLAGGILSSASALPLNRAMLPGTGHAKELLAACLRTEPRSRPSASVLLRHKYFDMFFLETFAAELREKLGKDKDEVVPVHPSKNTHVKSKHRSLEEPKQQWTLNIIPNQQSVSRADNVQAGDSLIDYNYSPGNQEQQTERSSEEKTSSKNRFLCLASRDVLPAAARPHPPKTLAKAINAAFQTFTAPVSNCPRTPYIKKIHNNLVLDSDLIRVRPSKKLVKKTQHVTLPYVTGATKSPLKKLKKIRNLNKVSWDPITATRTGTATGPKTPTNLPFV